MESENGVTVKEERIVSERTDVRESAKEQNADINGEGASNLKEASKQGTKSETKDIKIQTGLSIERLGDTLLPEKEVTFGVF